MLQQIKALETPVNASLSAAKDKLSQFGDFRTVVLASLYQLQQDTGNFGVAIFPKIDSSATDQALELYTEFNNAFNDAIVTFGGKASCKCMICDRPVQANFR